MKLEFDPAKSEKNARERGLPFELVEFFDWETCQTRDDVRHAYPEPRRVSVGFIGTRLHVVCHTRVKDGLRIISFRKANRREVRTYEEKKTSN
jgi:uncharacterized DUF497 family protein